MYSHEFYKRVRYAETDKMGYLYYGHYPKYYEIGRVETIRSLGLSYKDFEDVHKVQLPVVSMEVKYKHPAYYDENIRIKTLLTQMPTKLIAFDFELYNENSVLINSAHVKLFFIDMVTNKRVSIPQILSDKLQPYFES